MILKHQLSQKSKKNNKKKERLNLTRVIKISFFVCFDLLYIKIKNIIKKRCIQHHQG